MNGLTSVVYTAALTSFWTYNNMYITPEEVDGKIGFGCEITDVNCPSQVVANGD